MDRTRMTVLAGAVITIVAGAFAVGAAISSDDSGGGSEVAAPHTSHAAAAASGPVSSATPGTAPPVTATAQFEIEIAQFQFTPADAVVEPGTAVTWTNNDTDVHSIISTGDLFTSSGDFENGASYTFVFTEPGTYAYTCGVHPFMEGTITVEG